MDKKHKALRKLQLRAHFIQVSLCYNAYGGPVQENLDNAETLERLCWRIGKLARPVNYNAKWRKRMRFQQEKIRNSLTVAQILFHDAE